MKITQKHVHILGVKVDSTSEDEVLKKIQKKLKTGDKFYIVTPNPEQVLLAQKDDQFMDILNSADISIPDGIGLVAADKFYSLPQPANIIRRLLVLLAQGLGIGFSILFDSKWLQKDMKVIRGREMFLKIIEYASENNLKVVLIGDKYLSAQKAAKVLRQNYHELNITGLTGPDFDENANAKTNKDNELEKKLVGKINVLNPDIMFIGFGAPIQEKWLYRWYNKLNFKCAMVVGGTLDYISGKKKIPPKWVSEIGLEWLWRLLIGDQKTKRIVKAFPEFPIKIFWQKFIGSR